MDFISFPELFLALGAVIAVFTTIIGLMILVATELTEEGRWFLLGFVVPLGLVLLGLVSGGGFGAFLMVTALLLAIGVPWVLAVQRREDCFRTVLAGNLLFVVGGLLLVGLLSLHFTHFVR